ncbi:MAG: site-specific integrase [Deltaproteobacteria bacterium]|nr:MAG: site-specific integrase [Deltaproteobacteria bacterium]
MAVTVREKIKGTGEWWIFINHKGKRRSKKIGSKKAANQVKREVEARLARGELGLIREKCPTVAAYGKRWLNGSLQEWKDSTRDNYEGAFKRHIRPRLANKRLDEVRRVDVKYLIEDLKVAGKSAATIQVIKSVLSGIFTGAMEDEILSVNPCASTGKYVGNSGETEVVPLSADEVYILLKNTSERLSEAIYTLFLMLVRSGIRIGEALALEWPDIDFENREADINKSWDYVRYKLTVPKNSKLRKVDLSHNVLEALKRIRSSMKVIDLNGAIFTDEKGKRLEYRVIYKALQELAPRPMRIHDLRHTYATFRLSRGHNLLDVSKQLGHHKVAFTIDKYGHWIPGEHKDQVDELDEIAPIPHPMRTQ